MNIQSRGGEEGNDVLAESVEKEELGAYLHSGLDFKTHILHIPAMADEIV